LHRGLGSEGRIVELCDRDQVRLMIGAMKLMVPIRDLAPAAKSAPVAAKNRTKIKISATAQKPLPAPQRTSETTLDLRGERVEEGLGKVDAFIDRLMSRGEASGFVLHGHGTGAMKAGVREHLRASTYVEHSRAAEPDEGGDAFTVFWVRG
jgi:DNA mismatch repair protein MutS2